MRLHDLRLSADRPGHGRAGAARRAAGDRRALRSRRPSAARAPGSAGVFALAAIPARWALERRDWAEAAASLEPKPSRFPVHRGDDALRARARRRRTPGDLADARRSIDALQQIHDRLAQANEAYWAEQVAIQREGASAFLALAEGKTAAR